MENEDRSTPKDGLSPTRPSGSWRSTQRLVLRSVKTRRYVFVPALLVAWAAATFGWAELTGDSFLLAPFAVVGAAGLVVISVRSAIELGPKAAATTIAIAASVGSWLALFFHDLTVGGALVASVSVTYLALFIRAQWPDLREHGVLAAFGLGSPPADHR